MKKKINLTANEIFKLYAANPENRIYFKNHELTATQKTEFTNAYQCWADVKKVPEYLKYTSEIQTLEEGFNLISPLGDKFDPFDLHHQSFESLRQLHASYSRTVSRPIYMNLLNQYQLNTSQLSGAMASIPNNLKHLLGDEVYFLSTQLQHVVGFFKILDNLSAKSNNQNHADTSMDKQH